MCLGVTCPKTLSLSLGGLWLPAVSWGTQVLAVIQGMTLDFELFRDHGPPARCLALGDTH